ncbi:hypothetical protein MJO28_002011 [Puccinia striiformis f. sp. tritici]|uniref:Uncharacterized protein n=2 Tax=Puccinia striiformis TaxID=27350 RepID=A0A2S4VXC2_9BASI|nr:hypothetical protein Pst134EA_002753 [Puccinia striiformis f. sp. tritici]KAH9472128.1 hypothetical protein Pst134EA_002753 [Puccinia striiformis f. sp. tritici]KAI7961522.1 hypothetical protein MJO28_002011 [Puccinia striiformis f. sp. tritici]POW14148.1 hypothetical protein PSTT_03154 [Puccinia striiformis]
MDSLHPSLSQALPLRDYDAEQALQAPFRAAALGIATFYKKASENGRKAYSLGYSSALQDVLAYLQTALDQLDSQHPTESMSLTIQGVVDYIQRRQEALRAESQEPNEEEPSPIPQQTHQRQSTTPPSQSRHSPTYRQQQQQQQQAHKNGQDNNHNNQVIRPSSSAPVSLEPSSSVSHSTRRRTSPRRMTPVTFQPSSSSSSSGAGGRGNSQSHGSSFGRPPSSPQSSTGHARQPPFNLNFSSLSATPLPQHHQQQQQPSSIGPTTTTSSNRRHRGGPTDGTRKGKLKDRNTIGPDRSSSIITSSPITNLDHHQAGLIPHGYSHYAPTPPLITTPSSSFDTSKTHSSIGTNKRRFPVDTSTDTFSPTTNAAQPLRITRRNNNNNKTINSPIIVDQTNNTPNNPATSGVNEPTATQIHVHHHHDKEDVLMVLQGPNSTDHARNGDDGGLGSGTDDSDNLHHSHLLDDRTNIERASKRFFSCKNRY